MLPKENEVIRCPEPMTKELVDELVALEDTFISEATRLKWGVIYCKAGQTEEDDMYGNGTVYFSLLGLLTSFGADEWSNELEEFLLFLGQKVNLAEHKEYAGGLSTKGTSCSSFSCAVIVTFL